METYASVGHDGEGGWTRRVGHVGCDRQGIWDATGGARGTRGTRRAASQTATKRPVATNHPMALLPIQTALLVLCIAPAILVKRARGGAGGNLYEGLCACPSDVRVEHVPKRHRKQMVCACTMHGPWEV